MPVPSPDKVGGGVVVLFDCHLVASVLYYGYVGLRILVLVLSYWCAAGFDHHAVQLSWERERELVLQQTHLSTCYRSKYKVKCLDWYAWFRVPSKSKQQSSLLIQMSGSIYDERPLIGLVLQSADQIRGICNTVVTTPQYVVYYAGPKPG